MCLILTKDCNKKEIATEDIICYKAIKRINGKFVSFFREYPLRFDEVNTSYLEQPYSHYDGFRIDFGLHSFCSIEDVKLFFGNYEHPIVAVSIIPKGSSYYKGEFKTCVNSFGSYCSDALILSDIIKI